VVRRSTISPNCSGVVRRPWSGHSFGTSGRRLPVARSRRPVAPARSGASMAARHRNGETCKTYQALERSYHERASNFTRANILRRGPTPVIAEISSNIYDCNMLLANEHRGRACPLEKPMNFRSLEDCSADGDPAAAWMSCGSCGQRVELWM